MITIYHNPRCDISRKALALIQDKDKEIVVIDYFANPISENHLMELARRLDVHPLEMVRTTETLYKEKYADKELSEDNWVTVLAHNPELLHRPIVFNNNMAIIAIPPESVLRLLDQ
jgi:arsenate reductase